MEYNSRFAGLATFLHSNHAPMGIRYPQPDNEHDFEQLCLRFYRKLWKNESLMLYAKRGQKQHGVDIHDPACLTPARAVQCKHHETTKKISPAEIQAEVTKAEKFQFPLETYVIATTAQKSREAQDAVAVLNQGGRRFTVEIHFWEDILGYLNDFSQIQAYWIVFGRAAAGELAAGLLQDPDVRSTVAVVLAHGSDASPTGNFADIEQLLSDRRLEAAKYELDKLPDSDALKALPVHDQYKILRLRAKLALERGEFEPASRLFLDAYALQPDLDQAKQNQVLAYALIHDSVRAYALAQRYAEEGLVTPPILCQLIQNATTPAQLDALSPSIGPRLATNADVNLALSHALIAFGDAIAAAEAAARAFQIDPTLPHAHFAVGMCAHYAATTGISRRTRDDLERARTCYTAALTLARDNHYSALLPEVLINRAAVHALLGDASAAMNDYGEAVRTARQPAGYAARAVRCFLHHDDFARAAALLPLLDPSVNESAFLAAATRFHASNNDADRRQNLAELRQLAAQDGPQAVECCFHCIELALSLHEVDFARACVTEHFRIAFPFQAFTALAWIALEQGDKDTAADNATHALAKYSRDARPEERRILATVLMRLGKYADALDLLEQLAVPGLLDHHMRQLLDCAQRAERHDLLLRLCRELRESGELDDKVRRLEIRLLDKYAPEQGFAVADEYVRSSSSTTFFTAYRNLFAIRTGRDGELELDASRLPGPGDISPQDARIVVLPYLKAGMIDDALRFLYGQLRRHWDDSGAHGQFLSYFLKYSNQTSLTDHPASLEVDCAALLEVDDGSTRWVIIENDAPAPTRGEFAETHQLAQRALGRAVGDQVDLPAGLTNSQKATIREVQSKYVRTFQDSLQQFSVRFPEITFFQPIHVGTGDDFDPSAIIEILQKRRTYVNDCIALYRTTACTLHLFASRVGLSEVDAIRCLAQHSPPLVRCREMTPVEFENAVAAGLPHDTIVLDISAIATLTLCNGWGFLDPSKTYVVSQTTMELVARLASDASDGNQEAGIATLTDDGQLRYQEITEEQRESRRAERDALKAMVEERCEVRSSDALAAIAPDRRSKCVQFAGFHNMESMGVARDLNAILWTDDLVLSLLAKDTFKVDNVSTQVALRCFVESGALAMDEFDLASAKLASWGYTGITWSAATIIQAGRYAEWDTDAWPFKQSISLIANSGLPGAEKGQIALALLRLLRRSSCSELLQTAVIQVILNAVGDRGAVAQMRGDLRGAFPVDVVSEVIVRRELDYWLQSHIG